jgi:hypothetical protein
MHFSFAVGPGGRGGVRSYVVPLGSRRSRFLGQHPLLALETNNWHVGFLEVTWPPWAAAFGAAMLPAAEWR